MFISHSYEISITLPDLIEDEKVKLAFGIAWIEMEDVDKEGTYT